MDDPEFHDLVGEPDTQEGYIAEFWARFKEEGGTRSRPVIRKEITRSICEEIGCKKQHWQHWRF